MKRYIKENAGLFELYIPLTAETEQVPVLINIFGDTTIRQEMCSYEKLCNFFAENGFLTINYSCRQEGDIGEAVKEINSIFVWLIKDGRKYNVDSDKIYAVGQFEGASALAHYCIACTNADYGEEMNIYMPKGFRIKKIALNSGTYRMKNYLERSLASYITPNFPECFLVTVRDRKMREQAGELVLRLAENDIIYVYRLYRCSREEMEQGLQRDNGLKSAEEYLKEIMDFFKSFSVSD